ncbi:hypothetical protein [Nostoc sp.]|uniref:hypothetical protein n=1 Tax=Nostoc sp. TaxID=1180 RepID=UPI002FF51E1F
MLVIRERIKQFTDFGHGRSRLEMLGKYLTNGIGYYNKQSPPLWTKGKLRVLNPRREKSKRRLPAIAQPRKSGEPLRGQGVSPISNWRATSSRQG